MAKTSLTRQADQSQSNRRRSAKRPVKDRDIKTERQSLVVLNVLDVLLVSLSFTQYDLIFV